MGILSWFGPEPDDDDYSPGNTKIGGTISVRGDHIHVTHYSDRGGNGDKGVRLSADVYPGGRATNIHATDQNTNRHTSDPKDFRGGCCWIAILCGGSLIAASLTIARLLVT